MESLNHLTGGVYRTLAPIAHWSPLDLSCLKLNVGGAFHLGMDVGAIGVVCRDCFGQFRWAFIDKVKSISVFMTEVLALKRALLLALDLGHDKVVIETDCLPLFACVDAKSPNSFD